MDTTKGKKVMVLNEKSDGKTHWFKIGHAYLNRDGSTNIYLDALPASMKMQLRDYDEKDLAFFARRDAERYQSPRSRPTSRVHPSHSGRDPGGHLSRRGIREN